MLHDVFLGFVNIHILHHAEQEPVYGQAPIQELARHGYELSPDTLYPLLHQLACQGYLAIGERVVGGKVRKYYTATPAGYEAMAEVRELVDELLEGEADQHSDREVRAHADVT